MDSKDVLAALVILYVEDDHVVRPNVGKFLRRRCKMVIEAANGKEGLDEYVANRPDVVITDIEMPIMNGIEMIDKILIINENQVIIITTAYNDIEHKSNRVCKNLIKPIIREQMIEAIVECVLNSKK
ncbi:MAG: response regulator [Candidatus Magnetoovum sp. WYHC-5]|nr:response regulator [Candidatus Magnetoovum sp. WYHC-5]